MTLSRPKESMSGGGYFLRDLKRLSWVSVPGFEDQHVMIRCFGGKVPKTQSWVYVPLIASALGQLPGFRFDRKGQYSFSTPEQIADAQIFWRNLFARWDHWVVSLREGILRKFGAVEHCNIFHVRSISWTTTLVFGFPREWGILPHPSGKWQEDLIDSCLAYEYQHELFASILTIGQYKPQYEYGAGYNGDSVDPNAHSAENTNAYNEYKSMERQLQEENSTLTSKGNSTMASKRKTNNGKNPNTTGENANVKNGNGKAANSHNGKNANSMVVAAGNGRHATVTTTTGNGKNGSGKNSSGKATGGNGKKGQWEKWNSVTPSSYYGSTWGDWEEKSWESNNWEAGWWTDQTYYKNQKKGKCTGHDKGGNASYEKGSGCEKGGTNGNGSYEKGGTNGSVYESYDSCVESLIEPSSLIARKIETGMLGQSFTQNFKNAVDKGKGAKGPKKNYADDPSMIHIDRVFPNAGSHPVQIISAGSSMAPGNGASMAGGSGSGTGCGDSGLPSGKGGGSANQKPHGGGGSVVPPLNHTINGNNTTRSANAGRTERTKDSIPLTARVDASIAAGKGGEVPPNDLQLLSRPFKPNNANMSYASTMNSNGNSQTVYGNHSNGSGPQHLDLAALTADDGYMNSTTHAYSRTGAPGNGMSGHGPLNGTHGNATHPSMLVGPGGCPLQLLAAGPRLSQSMSGSFASGPLPSGSFVPGASGLPGFYKGLYPQKREGSNPGDTKRELAPPRMRHPPAPIFGESQKKKGIEKGDKEGDKKQGETLSTRSSLDENDCRRPSTKISSPNFSDGGLSKTSSNSASSNSASTDRSIDRSTARAASAGDGASAGDAGSAGDAQSQSGSELEEPPCSKEIRTCKLLEISHSVIEWDTTGFATEKPAAKQPESRTEKAAGKQREKSKAAGKHAELSGNEATAKTSERLSEKTSEKARKQETGSLKTSLRSTTSHQNASSKASTKSQAKPSSSKPWSTTKSQAISSTKQFKETTSSSNETEKVALRVMLRNPASPEGYLDDSAEEAKGKTATIAADESRAQSAAGESQKSTDEPPTQSQTSESKKDSTETRFQTSFAAAGPALPASSRITIPPPTFPAHCTAPKSLRKGGYVGQKAGMVAQNTITPPSYSVASGDRDGPTHHAESVAQPHVGGKRSAALGESHRGGPQTSYGYLYPYDRIILDPTTAEPIPASVYYRQQEEKQQQEEKKQRTRLQAGNNLLLQHLEYKGDFRPQMEYKPPSRKGSFDVDPNQRKGKGSFDVDPNSAEAFFYELQSESQHGAFINPSMSYMDHYTSHQTRHQTTSRQQQHNPCSEQLERAEHYVHQHGMQQYGTEPNHAAVHSQYGSESTHTPLQQYEEAHQHYEQQHVQHQQHSHSTVGSGSDYHRQYHEFPLSSAYEDLYAHASMEASYMTHYHGDGESV